MKDCLFKVKSVAGPWSTTVSPSSLLRYLLLAVIAVVWQKFYVMEWGNVKNVHDTCIVQLDYYAQVYCKLSTSQCTHQMWIQPSHIVSFCTAQWLIANLCESRLKRTDCKQKRNYMGDGRICPQSILFAYHLVAYLKYIHLETYFASTGSLSKLYLLRLLHNAEMPVIRILKHFTLTIFFWDKSIILW